jgi:hypothetical protein
MPLRARLHHRQRNPLALLVDAHHPDRRHVTDAHHVVRTLDVTIGQLADVDQSRIFEADVDERAEIHHVEDRPFQLHAGAKILDLQDALLEDGFGKVIAWVALGACQRFDDVAKCQLADTELLGHLGEIGFRQLGLKLGEPDLVPHHIGRELKFLQKLERDSVAFRVNPGSVKGVLALRELEEARRLRERGSTVRGR